jgi:hypothetical protein
LDDEEGACEQAEMQDSVALIGVLHEMLEPSVRAGNAPGDLWTGRSARKFRPPRGARSLSPSVPELNLWRVPELNLLPVPGLNLLFSATTPGSGPYSKGCSADMPAPKRREKV